MSDSSPTPDDHEDKPDELPLERPLTPREQMVVFRTQLILFIVMGLFIIAPFVVWWLLSQGK